MAEENLGLKTFFLKDKERKDLEEPEKKAEYRSFLDEPDTPENRALLVRAFASFPGRFKFD